MKIDTQLLDVVTTSTETYKVEVDGKAYIYVAHLDMKGKEVDFELRDEEGRTIDSVDNAELVEAIQDHLDSI